MESSRSTLVGLEVFLVRALVVGWWRAMHSSAALMSECVGSWGLCGELGARARQPFVEQGAGSDRGREPPLAHCRETLEREMPVYQHTRLSPPTHD